MTTMIKPDLHFNRMCLIGNTCMLMRRKLIQLGEKRRHVSLPKRNMVITFKETMLKHMTINKGIKML